MTTWAQLTQDERTTLNYFCENGVPVGVHVSRLPACYDTLSDYGLMTFTQTAQAVMVDVTPAGLAVWQQGQAASAPPRSVWVAEEGEHEDRYTLSIHTTEAGAKAACQQDWNRVVESHKDMNYPEALVWERDNWRDDIPGYYSQFGPYSVHQYSLVDDAE